jgi:hypothetical protein
VFKRLGSLNAHISRFHPDPATPGPTEGAEGQPSDLLSRAIQSAIAGASAALGQPQAQVGPGVSLECPGPAALHCTVHSGI